MAKLRRIVVPGVAYHVTQRGNNRQQVFFSDADYLTYIDTLKRHASRYQLPILGYCLMPNHVHLIVEPELEHSLSRTLQCTQSEFALYRNRRSASSGHLWQARFYSCPLSEAHFWTALRYVERNPSRAGLAAHAKDWLYSSAHAHCTGTDTAALLDLSRWGELQTFHDWPEMLDGSADDPMLMDEVRRATTTGRPVGHPDFVRALGRRPQKLALVAPSTTN